MPDFRNLAYLIARWRIFNNSYENVFTSQKYSHHLKYNWSGVLLSFLILFAFSQGFRWGYLKSNFYRNVIPTKVGI